MVRRRMGLPSAVTSMASASSINRMRAVTRRRLRGALAAMTRSEPSAKRVEVIVLRARPRRCRSPTRRAGVALKIGSSSLTT
jgi:hypothetical protein